MCNVAGIRECHVTQEYGRKLGGRTPIATRKSEFYDSESSAVCSLVLPFAACLRYGIFQGGDAIGGNSSPDCPLSLVDLRLADCPTARRN